MAEVWLRTVRRAGVPPKFLLEKVREECWVAVYGAIWVSSVDTSEPPVIDCPSSSVPSTTLEGLIEELRGTPRRRLRHLMVILFVPSERDAAWAGWAGHLLDLSLLFPEVCFRFATDNTGKQAFTDVPSGWLVFAGTALKNDSGRSLCDDLKDFFAGYREWFDPLGSRRAYRMKRLWKKELENNKQNEQREPVPALIVEDEREYAELLSYVAYRTGVYRPEIIASGECYERRFRNRVNSFPKDFLVIHSFDLPFKPFTNSGGQDDPDNIVQELRTAWHQALHGRKSYHRMIVTGGRNEGFVVIEPQRWRDNGNSNAFGWDDAGGNGALHRIRGLSKPLPWFHGLIESGLLPRAASEEVQDRDADGGSQSLETTFFDGVPAEKGLEGHSAPDRAQEIAGFLLERAREYVDEYLPTLAALLAMETMRTLRGHSATLYTDAMSLLCRAEVAVELEVGSAAGGDPRRATQRRASEVRALLGYLEAKSLLPEGMALPSRERLWTALRQKFLGAGAFEAADEALMEIHRARSVRWRGRYRRACSVGANFRKLRTSLQSPVRIRKWWRAVGPFCYWLSPLALIVLAYCTVLAHERSLRWLRDTAHPAHGWIVPVFAAVGLLWSFFMWPEKWDWVGAAIRPGRWLATAVLATLVLTTANIALLAQEKCPAPCSAQDAATSAQESRSIYGRYGLRPFVSAYLWTCGNAVGSETLPATLDIAAKAARIEFPGSGGGGEHRTLAQSVLWVENVLTGWVLFAFGLSAIYRLAVRE